MDCLWRDKKTINCWKIPSRRRRPRTDSNPEVRLQISEVSTFSTAPASVSDPGIGQSSFDDLSTRKSNELREFTHAELKSATRNFSPHNLLGEGGFGEVYKGVIKHKSNFQEGEEQLEVAVKQLKNNGVQGHQEWVTEVHFLGLVDSPYLVKLIGYCADEDERGMQRLLVYQYMQNRALDDHIFRLSPPFVPWQSRVKIALGAARGLAYLHEEMDIQVIFRDFKTSNILLDDEFNPKVSDFGLARQGPEFGKSHVTTGVKGTYGYAAPEYIQTGHLTAKSDVWSFGVVMLEILTGRRALDKNRPKLEQKLLEWVKPYISDPRKFHSVVDPQLERNYPRKAALKFSSIAMQCLVKQPKARPKMSDVVEGLKKVLEMTYLWGPPIPQPSPLHANTKAVVENNEPVMTLPKQGPTLPMQAANPLMRSPLRSINTVREQARTSPKKEAFVRKVNTKKSRENVILAWLPKNLPWSSSG